MDELWEDIPEFEGIYQISTNGRVKSLQRLTKNGVGFRKVRERIKKSNIDGNGYLQITLKNVERGLERRCYIHRLVAQAFIVNPENKREVNHKDSDRSNCLKSNLEWATPSENQQHSYNTTNRQGYFLGKISPMSVPVSIVKDQSEIKFTSFTACAKHLGVCINTVRNYLALGKTINGYRLCQR